MSQVGNYQSGELPPPDYNGRPESVDANFEMPVIMPYDEWRGGTAVTAAQQDTFPDPPEELLNDSASFPEPPPDYDAAAQRQYEGLIPPHKLPNPVLESKNHKDVNREIKLIARQGVNPLETKPELQKEFERRKFENRKKEQADNQKKNRTSLEQQLERQFQKIADGEKEETKSQERERKKSELEKIQERILAHSS